MKQYAIFLLLLFFSIDAFAQSNNQLFEMINASFIKYVGVEKEHYANRMAVNGNSEFHPLRFTDIYIALENYPLGFEFSSQIKELGFQFIYLQSNAAKKILNKPKTVVFMIGPTIEDNTLTIMFSPRIVTRKGDNINIIVSDWVKCTWQYMCDSRKWELIDVKSGGI